MELPAKALARHRKQGQLPTGCNRIYKTGDSVNLLMRPAEAIQVATNILTKAQLLMEEGLADEWTVKLWSTSGDKIKCGLEPAKNHRRKKSQK